MFISLLIFQCLVFRTSPCLDFVVVVVFVVVVNVYATVVVAAAAGGVVDFSIQVLKLFSIFKLALEWIQK